MLVEDKSGTSVSANFFTSETSIRQAAIREHCSSHAVQSSIILRLHATGTLKTRTFVRGSWKGALRRELQCHGKKSSAFAPGQRSSASPTMTTLTALRALHLSDELHVAGSLWQAMKTLKECWLGHQVIWIGLLWPT